MKKNLRPNFFILILIYFLFLNFSCAGIEKIAESLKPGSSEETSVMENEKIVKEESIKKVDTEVAPFDAEKPVKAFSGLEEKESANTIADIIKAEEEASISEEILDDLLEPKSDKFEIIDEIEINNDQVKEVEPLKITDTPARHTVIIKNGAVIFTPEKLIINAGDTVSWVNKDFTIDNHLFSSVPGTNPYDKEKDEIELVTLYGGQVYRHTYNKLGVYPYFCFIHKGMKGEVTVVRPGQSVTDMKNEVANLTKKKKKNLKGSKLKLMSKEMVLVKSGDFIMGSPEDPTEGPVKVVTLPAFYIDKYEVTNEEYEEFIDATDYKSEGDWRKKYIPGKEKHPVVNVSFNDATAYAMWAEKRLPTEAEWEKTARGAADRREWPWGDEFDNEITNVFGPDDYSGTAPVGSFEEDISPFGAYDMAGNVSEWVYDNYMPYKGSLAQNYPDFDPKKYVIRGGSFSSVNEEPTRTHSRTGSLPGNFFISTGFRLVKK